jgi:hypothetical protein
MNHLGIDRRQDDLVSCSRDHLLFLLQKKIGPSALSGDDLPHGKDQSSSIRNGMI